MTTGTMGADETPRSTSGRVHEPVQAARLVLTVEETARDVLGISPWLAYEEIKRTGQLAGIKPLRVGRRLLIPRAALERVLAGE